MFFNLLLSLFILKYQNYNLNKELYLYTIIAFTNIHILSSLHITIRFTKYYTFTYS